MIRLNHTSLHKIKLHGMQAYPEECCGVLLGRDLGDSKQVCDIWEVKNSKEENRERRFLISPEDYKQAEILAKDEKMDILGLYHSHPDHPARPSQFDLDHAFPYWSYIIVSVEDAQPSAVSSWLLKDDRSEFVEEHIEIVDGQFVHPCK